MRINDALNKIQIESNLLVDILTKTESKTIFSLPNTFSRRLKTWTKTKIEAQILRMFSFENPYYKSLSILPSNYSKFINNSDYDIVNLHWINAEMMSIFDIGKIKKPFVWTCHDMWPFCSIEHIVDANDMRWKEGYNSLNLNSKKRRIDIEKYIWRTKRKYWNGDFNFIAPSRWIYDCISESELMRNSYVETIPNPLDTHFWRKIDQIKARNALNLPIDKKIIMFVSMSGTSDINKGFNLLVRALEEFDCPHDIELLIVGNDDCLKSKNIAKKIKRNTFGVVNNKSIMRLLYSSADLIAMPSMIESFGQVATEASACGTPIVGFNTSGLRDIIIHETTGYLADPFSIDDLRNGLKKALFFKDNSSFSENIIKHINDNFSYQVVAGKYIEFYKRII